MKSKTHIIELLCDRLSGKVWEKSWEYPHQYTRKEAEALINSRYSSRHSKSTLVFRIVDTANTAPKRYRRHAAVTPLELRGAYAMLVHAQKHLIDDRGEGAYDAWVILTNAKDDIVRQLEAL
jgi:hypothetical protein